MDVEFGDTRGPVKWAGVAEPYAASFAWLCAGAVDPLLTAVGLGESGTGGPSRRLLDVGTGPGTLAALALARGARVTAVDPDPGMLRLASAAAPGADVRRAAVPGLPFADGEFEVVVANFVVNHVADPAAAVRDLVRVTAPGGRTGVTTWPTDRGVLGRIWAETLTGGGVDPAVLDPPAGTEYSRTPEGLSALLRDTGLTGVTARDVRWDFRIDPARLWQGISGGVAAIGQAFTGQPPEVRARMTLAYERAVAALRDGDEIVVPVTAVLAVGEKP